MRTKELILTFATATLVGCAEHRPTIVSPNLTATKQQRHYETSDDFRKRFGKKIFDYEHAKPTFNPKRLTQHSQPHPISQLPTGILSPAEASQLRHAGITSYSIYWEDYWWGRSYWFYFFYRNGNSFSYDVHTNAKKNAVIYD